MARPTAAAKPRADFEAFTALQQKAVRSVLANYSSVINFTFTEITETSTQHGDLRYAESDVPSTAWAYYPSTSAIGGDAWFNNSKNWYDTPVMGNYAWLTMLHETGHAHGSEASRMTTQGSFGAMPVDHDSLEYTVMSYRSYIGAADRRLHQRHLRLSADADDVRHRGVADDVRRQLHDQRGNTRLSLEPAHRAEVRSTASAQAAPGGNKIFMTRLGRRRQRHLRLLELHHQL